MKRLLLIFCSLSLGLLLLGALLSSYWTMKTVETQLQAAYDDMVSQGDTLNRGLAQAVFVLHSDSGEQGRDEALFNARVLVSHARAAKYIRLDTLRTFLGEDTGHVVEDLEKALEDYNVAADALIAAYRRAILSHDQEESERQYGSLLASIHEFSIRANRFSVALMHAEALVSNRIRSGLGRSARNQFHMLLLLGGFLVLTGTVILRQGMEKRRNMAELSRSEERLRHVVARAPLSMGLVDKDGRIVMVNEVFGEVFGYTLDEVPTLDDWWRLACPDEEYRARVRDAWDRAMADSLVSGHSMKPQEWRVVCRQGIERVVEFRMVPLDDIAVLVMIDLTRFRTLEEQLRRSMDEAEDANRAKSTFLANMSHEIRTPLNGVMGMIQLLDSTPLTEKQKEYVGISLDSCKRLTALLTDVLDLSRVEAGRLELRPESFSIRDKLDMVIQLHRSEVEEKGIALNLTLDESLPDILVGDASRLQQIVGNLLSNAVKFTRAGAVSLAASRLAAERGNEAIILIEVQDTGIGMSDRDLARLFEPFTQRDSSFTRKFQGAGLGLSIVRRLVELMGGTIAVDSEPGRGTHIFLTLPFGTGVAQQFQDTAVEGARSLKRATGGRVLVAEDDMVSRISLKAMLGKLGYEVGEALNGEDAVAEVRSGDYDLVFMDIQMPVMDGLEATRIIRGDIMLGELSSIPIIALTAYAMPGDKKRFLEAGMDDYLSKPVDMESLRDMAWSFLGRGAQQD